MDAIIVRPLSESGDIRAWLNVPHVVYADQPGWIPPLEALERHRISPKVNPYFHSAETELFVAYRGGKPVGRISAQIDRRYLRLHNDATGQFGFFDVIDAPVVGTALTSAAANWLSAQGIRRMSGPFNFSINEECGLLVKGFDIPPAMMMPHSAPWQGGMLEAAGLAPEMDLYAYRVDPFAPPELVTRILHRAAMQNPRITARSFDRKNLRAELAVMVDIFNDAWRENWGYFPLTKEEIEYLLGDLRLFFRGYYGTFVCWDGVPVGFCLIVPDVNGIIAEFDGRLMPLNWLRLIYSLTFNRFRSMRMPLLGLRRSFQGTLLGTQIFAALYTQAMAPLRRVPSLSWLEFSWVLASNRPLVTFLHSILGNPVKTYRIYAGALPLADPAARQNT